MREKAVDQAGSSWEDRGLYQSGGRMSDQAEAGQDVDRQRMDFEAGIRDQVSEQYLTTALDVARLRRELTEKGMSAAQANAIASAQAGLGV